MSIFLPLRRTIAVVARSPAHVSPVRAPFSTTVTVNRRPLRPLKRYVPPFLTMSTVASPSSASGRNSVASENCIPCFSHFVAVHGMRTTNGMPCASVCSDAFFCCDVLPVKTFAAAYAPPMSWQVYLSGEIHTDWRERIERGAADAGLDVAFSAPVTDHAASDDCGVTILGPEEQKFWHDHVGAGVNAIRTRTLLEQADVVVVRFGDQYKQWNAAFDAGQAAALGKPLITLHPEGHDHALKEVDRAALAVAREPEQVVAILRYVIDGTL